MKRKINNYVKYFSIILGVLVLVLFVGCSVVTPTDPIIYTFSAVPATITAGDYIFELTVREDTYDGTLIYTSQTEINLTDDIDDKQFVTFDFPSNSIEENSTVTFSLTQISGSGSCLYAVNGQY